MKVLFSISTLAREGPDSQFVQVIGDLDAYLVAVISIRRVYILIDLRFTFTK